MSDKFGTRADLLRANAELRNRLEETEETLRAIQAGEVDALVVNERVYTLEGAESPYRHLVEAISEGAATLADDGTILYCNAGLGALLGRSVETLVGAPLRGFVVTDDLLVFDATLAQGIQGLGRGEVRFRRDGGAAVPVQLSCSGLELAGGRGICVVATDLSEQKRNEEVIATDTLTRAILDQAADAILVCDPDGRIVRASRAALALVGRNCLFQRLAQAVPLEVAGVGPAETVLERVMRGETFHALDARLPHPTSGEGRWLLASAAPLRNERALGAVITLVDVTARRLVEGDLRVSEERYRLLVDLAPDAMIVHRSGEIVYANSAALHLFGATSPEALIGTSVLDRIHPDDRPSAPSQLGKVKEGGATPLRALRMLRLDGSAVDVETTASGIEHQREPAVQVIVRNVSERKRAERFGAAINAVRRAILLTRDADEVMQAVLVEGAKAIGCETAAISLRQSGRWVVRHVLGFPPDVIGTLMNDKEEPHAVLAIDTRSPVAIDDAFSDERVNRDRMRKWGIRSVLVVPLLTNEDVVGVLFFNFHKHPVSFTVADVDFASQLAISAGLALENARLFAELQRQLSERSQTETALQRREERYRAIVEAANEGVWVVDAAARTTFVNRAMAEMLGYTREEMIGRASADFMRGGDRLVGERLERRREGLTESFELELTRKDGSSLWVIANAAPLVDSDGTFAGSMGMLTDISERKAAEAELAHLASFPRLNPNPIVEVDQAGRVRFCNPAAESLFPDLRQRGADHPFLAQWRAVLESLREEGARTEKREVAVGDRWYQQFWSGVDALSIIRIYGMDATEWKRIEEELRETRDYLENLFTYANAPIIVWDPELRITRFNRAFERLTGRRAEDVIGQRLELLFPEPTREESLAHIRRTMTGERWDVVEIPIERVDGGVRTVLWNSATILGADGTTAVATMAQGHDITERKSAEEELRETRDYLENLFTYANAPIIVWNPELRITRFNRAFERLTGRRAEDVIGQHLELLFPEQTREESLVHIRRTMAGERWEVVEIPIERVDGGVRTVLWNSATILGADGTTAIATMAQGHDITERKQAEAERQRSLENLEQFAYVASHDLQEPLRMMASYSQLLERRYKERLDTDASEFIGFIVDGAVRMQRLINDLLAYSRVGRTDTPPEPIDCNAVLDRVKGALAPSIEETGAVITSGSLPVVTGSESQLVQLFQNLVGNAIKFHGSEPPRVRVGAVKNHGEWVFSVEDNGIGIEPQYAERIFQVFQRLHPRGQYPGTGIGLAICKKIVESQGGRIWVESEPGNGSTFHFTIHAKGEPADE